LLKTKRKTYGNTWWGQELVNVLKDMDSDRLSRGRSLANRGFVENIRVVKGKVTAKVESSGNSYYYSYPSSYRVSIKFDVFTKDEIIRIKQIIAENSSIAVELGMGNFPESLLGELKKENIALFPENWEELETKCTCYDFGYEDICKHLAAVFYLFANEVDKDPFLLFQLKGLKKTDMVKMAGVNTESAQIKTISMSDKFIEFSELKHKKVNINIDDFEFSFPKYDIKQLLSLLAENPPFYNSGNFKTFIENIFNFTSLKIEDAFPVLHEEPELIKNEFQLEYNPDWYVYPTGTEYSFKIIPDKEASEKAKQEILEKLQVENPKKVELIKYNPYGNSFFNYKIKTSLKKYKKTVVLLPALNNKTGNLKLEANHAICPDINGLGFYYFLTTSATIDYDKASNSFGFLNVLSSMALGLVKANLFIPELVAEKKENNFSIRYIPVVNDKVQAQIDKLKQIMPQPMCNKGEEFLSEDSVLDLLSAFITYIVKIIISQENKEYKDKIISVFAINAVFEPVDFNEKNTHKTILNWLEKIYISKKEIAPVIRIEEAGDENFGIYVDVINKKNALDPIIPVNELFPKKKSEQGHMYLPEISRQLIIAGQYMPELKTIIDSKGKEIPTLSLEQMAQILVSTAGIFDVLGIQIILPKELKKLAYPYLHVKAKVRKSNETGVGYLNLHEMLDFSYEVALGDQYIPLKDFRKLVKDTQGLLKYKDQYLLLKPDEVKNILNKLKEPPPQMSSSMQALYTAVTGEYKGIKFEADEALKKILDDFTKIEDITTPEALNATLRPYQERGYKWLYSNAKKGFGSCIADDMGLGKTIQVITLLLEYKKQNKTQKSALVVCPTTLIGNWEKECQKFAPSLNLNIYHGSERELNTENIDILITSYGTFRRDIEKFNKKDWSFLIIDEAQNIKNSETLQTKAVKALKADNYIAMTGTPVENRLTELWNIFDFVNKGYLGSLTQFKTELSSPIEKYKDKAVIEKLKKATAPFILRRLKTDKAIISDLPDKLTFDEYCYLTKEQAAVYQNIVDDIMGQVEHSGGIQRKGLIFKLITSLKQICNHPVHFAKKGNIESESSGKSAKMLTILENILDNREKAIIFTQYKEMGDILQEIIKKELKEEAIFFHGGITRTKRDEMVNSFQNDRKTKLMIISLKAGGTGLNLTEASNVIHYDLWWNPAVENQATDRAYRIGQDKNVMVHRLITLGTFEEKIDEIIKSKKELADLTVSTGESWITEMSNKDLRDIFTLYK